VFGGYHWYQKLAVATGDGVDRYASLFFDRDHAAVAAVVSPDYQVDNDVSRAFVADYFDRCDATTPLERALRIDTHVMLVEDPVKRVDNTTMAWGLEGRVPFLDHELVELATSCPAELLVADGGKGILKDLARHVVPHEVIDRPKGYFPVPPLIQLEGPYVDLLAGALQSQAAVDRGLFRPEQVRHLLDHPNELTTLRYNKLWGLGLLELWLQAIGV
jgi:asparagine synthase (glutamine-hydrolysing)